MEEGNRISQYDSAAAAELTSDTVLIINTPTGKTKKTTWGELQENSACQIKCASLEIATADVLQLNSTPLDIVLSPGSGKAIEVISASVKIDFNSAAYATNVIIELITDGATDAQYGAGILNATVSTHKKLQEITTTTATDTQLLVNADLKVSVKTGDPTAGDSDITVYVLYREIEI